MSELKVVVTGGAGFIGSHIAEYWSQHDAEVHLIDNLRTGNYENIQAIKSVIFHNVSITDREAVFEIMEGAAMCTTSRQWSRFRNLSTSLSSAWR